MVNNVQSKIKTLSNEVKKLAAFVLAEKASAENIQRNAELGSESYDEDDFTNLINGYQYVIDELRAVCEHFYESLWQYEFVLKDMTCVKEKYSKPTKENIYNGEINGVYSRFALYVTNGTLYIIRIRSIAAKDNSRRLTNALNLGSKNSLTILNTSVRNMASSQKK